MLTPFTTAIGYRPLHDENQIVEHDWEYAYDYWDGPCEHEEYLSGKSCPNPYSVALPSPEWIGRPARECAFVLEFRIPIQRRLDIKVTP